MNTPNTTSVKQTDIFISWNSLDRELKNIIFNNLKDNYVVWESDVVLGVFIIILLYLLYYSIIFKIIKLSLILSI